MSANKSKTMWVAAAALTVWIVLSSIAPPAAMACEEPFLGTIMLMPYDFVPQGWMYCEGQLLAIASYQALFSLLGTTFGGDGRTSFAVPDLRDASPLPNMRYAIAIVGIYPRRP